jgi:hypothetical protein
MDSSLMSALGLSRDATRALFRTVPCVDPQSKRKRPSSSASAAAAEAALAAALAAALGVVTGEGPDLGEAVI